MQKRRRFRPPIQSLEERPAEEAKRLREEAELLLPGPELDAILRRARQSVTGSQVSEWLHSVGLQAPQ
jgi:hypothetical protein